MQCILVYVIQVYLNIICRQRGVHTVSDFLKLLYLLNSYFDLT